MPKQEYFYYFESGGWNSEYATSVKQARKQAQERWAHCPDLKPRLDSFKPVKGNEDTYKSLNQVRIQEHFRRI
jgi:hypothetical protein